MSNHLLSKDLIIIIGNHVVSKDLITVMSNHLVTVLCLYLSIAFCKTVDNPLEVNNVSTSLCETMHNQIGCNSYKVAGWSLYDKDKRGYRINFEVPLFPIPVLHEFHHIYNTVNFSLSLYFYVFYYPLLQSCQHSGNIRHFCPLPVIFSNI